MMFGRKGAFLRLCLGVQDLRCAGDAFLMKPLVFFIIGGISLLIWLILFCFSRRMKNLLEEISSTLCRVTAPRTTGSASAFPFRGTSHKVPRLSNDPILPHPVLMEYRTWRERMSMRAKITQNSTDRPGKPLGGSKIPKISRTSACSKRKS